MNDDQDCEWFWWLGQSLNTCDECGRSANLHKGLGPEHKMPWPEAVQRNRLLRHQLTPIGETEPIIPHPESDTVYG